VFINHIDYKIASIFFKANPFRQQVLDRGKTLGRLSNRTLGVLRSLAYNSSQVPNHYKIDRNLVFDVEPEPFASGGFSDVRRGNLGDRLVSISALTSVCRW